MGRWTHPRTGIRRAARTARRSIARRGDRGCRALSERHEGSTHEVAVSGPRPRPAWDTQSVSSSLMHEEFVCLVSSRQPPVRSRNRRRRCRRIPAVHASELAPLSARSGSPHPRAHRTCRTDPRRLLRCSDGTKSPSPRLDGGTVEAHRYKHGRLSSPTRLHVAWLSERDHNTVGPIYHASRKVS